MSAPQGLSVAVEDVDADGASVGDATPVRRAGEVVAQPAPSRAEFLTKENQADVDATVASIMQGESGPARATQPQQHLAPGASPMEQYFHRNVGEPAGFEAEKTYPLLTLQDKAGNVVKSQEELGLQRAMVATAILRAILQCPELFTACASAVYVSVRIMQRLGISTLGLVPGYMYIPGNAGCFPHLWIIDKATSAITDTALMPIHEKARLDVPRKAIVIMHKALGVGSGRSVLAPLYSLDPFPGKPVDTVATRFSLEDLRTCASNLNTWFDMCKPATKDLIVKTIDASLNPTARLNIRINTQLARSLGLTGAWVTHAKKLLRMEEVPPSGTRTTAGGSSTAQPGTEPPLTKEELDNMVAAIEGSDNKSRKK
jgi:hypothetical protein